MVLTDFTNRYKVPNMVVIWIIVGVVVAIFVFMVIKSVRGDEEAGAIACQH